MNVSSLRVEACDASASSSLLESPPSLVTRESTQLPMSATGHNGEFTEQPEPHSAFMDRFKNSRLGSPPRQQTGSEFTTGNSRGGSGEYLPDTNGGRGDDGSSLGHDRLTSFALFSLNSSTPNILSPPQPSLPGSPNRCWAADSSRCFTSVLRSSSLPWQLQEEKRALKEEEVSAILSMPAALEVLTKNGQPKKRKWGVIVSAEGVNDALAASVDEMVEKATETCGGEREAKQDHERMDGIVSLSSLATMSLGSDPPPLPTQQQQQPCQAVYLSFDLSLEDVSLAVYPFRCPLRGKVALLTHVNAYIPAGSIACVLAPRQRHASAVLSTLVGIENKVDGRVLVNGLPANDSNFHAYVAYISTVNGIDMESTVKTNLLFSARMRVAMPEAAAGEEKEESRRVNYAVKMALLSQFLNSTAKSLSPAQLYQLAIAMELVRGPVVLLLDAPLDNFTLAEMQTFLTVLANILKEEVVPFVGSEQSPEHSEVHQRRTIVLSVTDIPLPLYSVTSHLIMLSNAGEVLYSGEKSSFESFLAEDVGVPNAQGEMIADLLAQMEDTGSTHEMAQRFADSAAFRRLRIQLSPGDHHIVAGGHAAAPTDPAAVPVVNSGDSSHNPPAQPLNRTRRSALASGAPSYAEQIRLLTIFTLRKYCMTMGVLVPWVCLVVVFVIMFLVLAFAGHDAVNNVQNPSGVIFFLLSCCLLLNSVSFDIEIGEYSTFVHMRNNAYFKVSQYIITTALRLLIPRLVTALLVACFSLLIFRAASLPLIIVFTLTSLSHANLFIFLLYWVPTRNSLTALWHFQYWYYGYCSIVSGYIIALSQIPPVLQFLSLLRIGFGGLIATELRTSSFGCGNEATQSDPSESSDWSDSSLSVDTHNETLFHAALRSLSSSESSSSAFSDGPSPSQMPCFKGTRYLEQRGLANDSWGRSAVILLLTTVILFSLVALSMYTTWSPRRL